MSVAKNISVLDILGKTLNSREAVYEVFRPINFSDFTSIQLDFKKVEFMSRSFADELFKYRLSLETEKNIYVNLVNINREISNILEAVSNSNLEGRSARKVSKVNHIKLNSQEALSNYLLAL